MPNHPERGLEAKLLGVVQATGHTVAVLWNELLEYGTIEFGRVGFAVVVVPADDHPAGTYFLNPGSKLLYVSPLKNTRKTVILIGTSCAEIER